MKDSKTATANDLKAFAVAGLFGGLCIAFQGVWFRYAFRWLLGFACAHPSLLRFRENIIA